MNDKALRPAVTIGGTIVACILSFVLLLVVSTIVAGLAGMMNYYMGGMRWEGALFIGNIIGGVMAAHAARGACDAVLKSYSKRTVFVVVAILLGVGIIYQLSKGFSQETVMRLASVVPMLATSWFAFWNDEYY